MHVQIKARGLPIALRDDFYEQCAQVEGYAGGNDFRRARSRARALNLLSGILAAPVLLAVIAGILADKFFDGFDVFAWAIANTWVFVVAGLLAVAVLVVALFTRAANRTLLRREYPVLLARAGLA